MVPLPLRCTNCRTANPPQATYCNKCGQKLLISTLLSKSATGLLNFNTVLNGRYRIIEKLGEGGMGAVYKAADTKFNNRLVAIKEMSESELKSQEDIDKAIDAFEQEAQLLASLMHPNLPHIYEQFPEMGRRYLVMDFIEGQTLKKHLATQGGTLQIEEVLDIGIQLCSVLDYLHSRHPPIIFRDLTPDNVMITPNQYIYLIDFGIARNFHPGKSFTEALGKRGYAAPEQYRKGAIVTPLADIYGLGAILHELLTGHDALTNTPDIFQFPPINSFNPSVPSDLETLILQMLRREPDKRPASANDIKDELQRIQILQKISTSGGQPFKNSPKPAPPSFMPALLPNPTKKLPTPISPAPINQPQRQRPNPGQPAGGVFQPINPRPPSANRPPARKAPAPKKKAIAPPHISRRNVLKGLGIAGGAVLAYEALPPLAREIFNLPFPNQEMLYQENGLDHWKGWIGSSDWKVNGKLLMNDGSQMSEPFYPPFGKVMSVPYQVDATSDYAVEVSMMVTFLDTRIPLWEVGVRGTNFSNDKANWKGYYFTIFSNADAYIDSTDYRSVSSGMLQIAAAKPQFDVSNWHTYRIEVVRSLLRLFVDGNYLTGTRDDKFPNGGLIFLNSSQAKLTIRSFTVFAIDAGPLPYLIQ